MYWSKTNQICSPIAFSHLHNSDFLAIRSWPCVTFLRNFSLQFISIKFWHNFYHMSMCLDAWFQKPIGCCQKPKKMVWTNFLFYRKLFCYNKKSFWEILKTIKTEKPSSKPENWAKTRKPDWFIVFQSIFEFSIENRLKTSQLISQTDWITSQTNLLTDFHL
jgi:hypothetical protein